MNLVNGKRPGRGGGWPSSGRGSVPKLYKYGTCKERKMNPGLTINSTLASPTLNTQPLNRGSPLIAGLPRPRYGAIMAWQVCAMLLMRVAMDHTGMPTRRYNYSSPFSSGWLFTFSPQALSFHSFHPFFLIHKFYFLPLAARAPLFFSFPIAIFSSTGSNLLLFNFVIPSRG